VRSHVSLRPDTYTESTYVDVAGISEKVDAHYPGRSAPEQWAEVSRSHSVCWAANKSGGLKSLWCSNEGRHIQRWG